MKYQDAPKTFNRIKARNQLFMVGFDRKGLFVKSINIQSQKPTNGIPSITGLNGIILAPFLIIELKEPARRLFLGWIEISYTLA
jgi:hypothetical protein